MEILKLLELKFNLLTPKEKKLAEYVKKNIKELSSLSIQELSNLSEVSTTGITRFIKKLGFRKYIDFKIEIAKNKYSEKVEKIEVVQNENILNIIKNLKEKNSSMLKDFFDLIQLEILEKSIDILDKANSIFLYGIGANGVVALDFQYKLLRINKKVTFYLDTSIQVVSSNYATSSDVAVILSYSGKTKEIISIVENLKRNKTQIVGITSLQKSYLRENSEFVIDIPVNESILKIGAFSSRISQLLAIDLLVLGLSSKHISENFQFIKESRSIDFNK